MRCPKCDRHNPEEAQFCTRCHAPLRFTCPACGHRQGQGGKCEECGVDFGKYGAMLMVQWQQQAAGERQRVNRRTEVVKQILLLPVTGGLSLMRFLFSRARSDRYRGLITNSWTARHDKSS